VVGLDLRQVARVALFELSEQLLLDLIHHLRATDGWGIPLQRAYPMPVLRARAHHQIQVTGRSGVTTACLAFIKRTANADLATTTACSLLCAAMSLLWPCLNGLCTL
jgi:hypothetical protein